MIYNSKYHFLFYGVKIISLLQLRAMKMRRNEAKDLLDCQSIALAYGNKGKFESVLLSVSQQLFYYRIKFKTWIICFLVRQLKYLGIYGVIKSLKDYFFRVDSV